MLNMAQDKVVAVVPFLEMFAGSARLTQAVQSLGWAAGPPVDINPTIGGDIALDMLQPYIRRSAWALIVAIRQVWVHAGCPWTFLSRKAN